MVGLRGLESLMPEEAYQNPGFKWGYGAEEEEGAVIGARERTGRGKPPSPLPRPAKDTPPNPFVGASIGPGERIGR